MEPYKEGNFSFGMWHRHYISYGNIEIVFVRGGIYKQPENPENWWLGYVVKNNHVLEEFLERLSKTDIFKGKARWVDLGGSTRFEFQERNLNIVLDLLNVYLKDYERKLNLSDDDVDSKRPE